MDKWFVILLGVLVAVLYIPPIVVPARHRELALRLIEKPDFFFPFGIAMVAIGVVAMLLGNKPDLHHRILFVFGIIETVGGILLLSIPAFFVPQIQFLASKPG